jgi:hypothetical protein
MGSGTGNEDNYMKMLETALASNKLRGKHILLAPRKRIPDLSRLTTKPDELEFLSKIPFDYELLEVQKIIKLIVEKSEKNSCLPREHIELSITKQEQENLSNILLA